MGKVPRGEPHRRFVFMGVVRPIHEQRERETVLFAIIKDNGTAKDAQSFVQCNRTWQITWSWTQKSRVVARTTGQNAHTHIQQGTDYYICELLEVMCVTSFCRSFVKKTQAKIIFYLLF